MKFQQERFLPTRGAGARLSTRENFSMDVKISTNLP